MLRKRIKQNEENDGADAQEAGVNPAGYGVTDSLDEIDAGWSRRSFLKAAGFTLAGAAASCGRAPVEKAIPYLVQPEGITPGVALFYASTCGECSAGCGTLVKTREGRPVKLEGNPDHPVSHGGLCAVGQASLLGLYDSRRLQRPVREGEKTTWAAADQEIMDRLGAIRRRGGAVRFLTDTMTGPSTLDVLRRFLEGFPDARHVVYDPLSSSAIPEAHARTHGVRVLPRYHFERAAVIVGFEADFLGTWISPVEFTAGYRAGRTLEGAPPRFSYHVQFESRLSLTGSRADRRVALAPEETGAAMSRLARRLADLAGVALPGWAAEIPSAADGRIDALAGRLRAARGRSLVVCGVQDAALQRVCNLINHLLGNYGRTLDLAHPSYQRQGDDAALERLLQELADHKVAALFVAGVDPVSDLPGGTALAAALHAVPLTVSFSRERNETAEGMHFVCPEPHPLESWGDAEAVAGVFSLCQPAIRPLGDTRTMAESLAAWMGAPQPARAIVQDYWKRHVFPRRSGTASFQAFWDRSLQDGYVEIAPAPVRTPPFAMDAVRPVVETRRPEEGRYRLVLYPKIGLLDGRHAYNPWLQELPDPVSKATWDNYACLSPAAAKRLGVEEGDVVRLENDSGDQVALPVYVQPGQHENVVAVALGYGRKATERFAGIGPRWLQARPAVGPDGRIGKNISPFLRLREGALRYADGEVRVTGTGKRQPLACTQGYASLRVPEALMPAARDARPLIGTTTLSAFRENPSSGVYRHPHEEDLWPDDHPYPGHHWGMVIDMTACTGCSACVVACQAENNIPVVGKDEVRRHREMHWMRIDRYYAETEEGVEVDHQVMLCQQCDHAPCETVCPVLATVHSKEGLNEQVYNRCIGTRYCANNCPYKVRRFNWFDYSHEDRLQNMALNPDVTVRSRGVMEKCTFCVQRIQEARIEAKKEGRPLADGDIRTACQQSCPAGAILFGDTNDPESRVSRLMRNPRSYRVLEELNIHPSVEYLTRVRNQPEEEGGEENG